MLGFHGDYMWRYVSFVGKSSITQVSKKSKTVTDVSLDTTELDHTFRSPTDNLIHTFTT